MNIPLIFWIVPAAAVIALAVAWAFYRSMKREDEGTPRMREIAEHVRKGAMAYLRQQYKVVLIVFIILALFFAYLAYGVGVQNPWVPFAFLTGGFFSGLAGYFGMKTATYASARTANAARQSLDRGLKVAFRSGAVMGLVVVGLGLLDISFWYIILERFVEVSGPQKLVVITTTMLTFGMGASTQALFARVGGGIYTKAADVGADLVGKVEAGIPEDDPRNPATPRPSPTTWATTWATWPAWAPTSTRAIAARCSPQRRSARLLSPLRATWRCRRAPCWRRC